MLVHCFLSTSLLLIISARPSSFNVGLNGSDSKIAAAWYAGWHSDGQSTPDFPLSAVPWSKYTHLTYAFAETTPDVFNVTLGGSNPELLPAFVSEAKKHGVKPLISVGGWTGSRFFSRYVIHVYS